MLNDSGSSAPLNAADEFLAGRNGSQESGVGTGAATAADAGEVARKNV